MRSSLLVAFLQFRKPGVTLIELAYGDEIHHPHLLEPEADAVDEA